MAEIRINIKLKLLIVIAICLKLLKSLVGKKCLSPRTLSNERSVYAISRKVCLLSFKLKETDYVI